MEHSQDFLPSAGYVKGCLLHVQRCHETPQAYLVFGIREEAQNARVVVDGFIKAVVIRLHYIVHQVFNSFPLSSQL